MQLNQIDSKKAKAIALIISETSKKHGVYGVDVKPSDIQILHTQHPYVYLDPCPFLKYFYSRNAVKPCRLFAYKKAKRVLAMLKADELHLTNLELNEENDPSEYQEFWLRIGNISQMIPDDYATNKFWLCNCAGKIPMDDIKQKVYLYCFTNTFNLPRHWMEYADGDAGVCVEYDISITNGRYNDMIKFGRVNYDSGYDFDFIKEICHKIRRKCSIGFIPQGFTNFSKFYKRDKYCWEDETRLVIDLSKNKSVFNMAEQGKGGMRFATDRHGNVNEKVLILENNSAQIKWTIRNLFFGGRINPGIAKRITNVLKRKYQMDPQ